MKRSTLCQRVLVMFHQRVGTLPSTPRPSSLRGDKRPHYQQHVPNLVQRLLGRGHLQTQGKRLGCLTRSTKDLQFAEPFTQVSEPHARPSCRIYQTHRTVVDATHHDLLRQMNKSIARSTFCQDVFVMTPSTCWYPS